ncbi:ABC transporter ATP-binding protein [Agathobaculum sp.]|uniref:ABC transporter ATP-binding protein n=1 Tax=Agathobaculum sp. TaxID=2048138 RepID=UPI002A7F47C5|nr:ABC transporter ATP-binding protein [Agathobaculum sp.]MDY3618055.1 ABC transporter ATP-binding protein [Agathobaculum sp.]
MIRCVDLCKSYQGKQVLKNINWEIKQGECWQVCGASGIGKTTLLRLVMGLETPDRGMVLGAEGLHFAPVFQEDVLIEDWSPMENLELVYGRKPSAEILRALLPDDSLEQPVRTLSGGMRRRVAIARALLVESDLLVMDEPFAGLDQENIRNAIAVIEVYRRRRTWILVSHGAEELLSGMRTFTLE